MTTQTETLLQDAMRNRGTTVATISLSKGIMCLTFPFMLVLDWDARQLTDSPRSEKSGGPTVDSREEALGLVAADVLQYPQDLWALYSTKQGLRALLLSALATPATLETRFELMRPDPIYLAYCRAQQQWIARVSRKPHRSPETDKIQFLGVLGTGKPNREMVEGLQLHHFLLRQNGMTDRELSLTFDLPPREAAVVPKAGASRSVDDDIPF